MSNSVFDEESNTWIVNRRIRFKNIHPRSKCEGRNCIVHNPSDTIANREDWPYEFREGLMGKCSCCGQRINKEATREYVKGFFLEWVNDGGCPCCFPYWEYDGVDVFDVWKWRDEVQQREEDD